MLIREKLEYYHFSTSEEQVVEFLLEHISEIDKLSIKDIAKQCFTVPSTLVRISHKMGYEGWKELKNVLLQEERYLQEHFTNIDANQPFERTDSIMTIANKLAILKKETIDDTLSLVHHDHLQNAIKILNRSQTIHIFSISHNPMLTQKFQYDMERIHKHVIIHHIQNDFIYHAHLLENNDCGLFISYTGETQVINETIKVLKDKKIPIIALTSIGDNIMSKSVDCILRITTREKLYSKIASYSTDESIIYLLELLYSCLFQLNYTKNLEEKTTIAKLTESRKSINNNIIKEKE